MNWFAQWFSRRRIYSDLSAEIQEHLHERMEELIAEGMPKKDAEAAARREFGNVMLVAEDSREVWRWRSIENFAIDVRYGLRSLRRSPGFTIIVVLTLALGIGANSAIFSVINAVLLRPLPFPNASQLADLCARSTLFDFEHLGVSLPDIADIRASGASFSNLSPYQLSSKEMSGDGKPERIEGAEISEDFFPDLGVKPVLGRTFVSSDMQPGGYTVILSHAFGDVTQAQKELDTIAARLASAYPDADKGWSFRVTPLRRYLLGDARKPLLVLFSSVGFVLLIACANVSNLFLSRG